METLSSIIIRPILSSTNESIEARAARRNMGGLFDTRSEFHEGAPLGIERSEIPERQTSGRKPGQEDRPRFRILPACNPHQPERAGAGVPTQGAFNQTPHSDALGLLERLSQAPEGAATLPPALEAMRRLPSVYFLLLHQLYVERLPLPEIARRCGRPEAAIEQWHQHALRAYTKQLQKAQLIPRAKPEGRAGSKRSGQKRTTPKSLPADKRQFEMFPQPQVNDAEPAGPSLTNAKGPQGE